MGDSFKPIVEGMDFCNIDGTGWPLSVCVSNGGDTLNGRYECRDYVPDAEREELAERLSEVLGARDGIIPSTHSSTPRFCPSCGARVV